MAHNLAIDEKTGEAALFLLKQKAWHGLGQTVEEAKTSEEVIKIAHLDWDVVKTPNYVTLPNGLTVPSGSFSTIREDNSAILAPNLGKDYTVVQNVNAFELLDSLVNIEDDIIYNTAGALGKGEVVFITAKLPNYIRIKGSDTVIEKYILVSNSHIGNAMQAGFTDIDVVCNNTLNAAKKTWTNKVTMRHTLSITDRMKDGYKILGLAKTYNEEMQKVLNAFADFRVTEKQVKDIVNYTFLSSDELALLAAGVELSTRKNNIMNEITSSLHSAPGQDRFEGTALWVYNGVTSYFQNVKKYASDTRKMSGLNFGGEEQFLAQKTFNQLVELVK